MLPLQGARLRFLVGELRSDMPCSVAKKKKMNFKTKGRGVDVLFPCSSSHFVCVFYFFL